MRKKSKEAPTFVQQVEALVQNWEPKPCHKCQQEVPATDSKQLVLRLLGVQFFAPLGADLSKDQHISRTRNCPGSPSMRADINGTKKTKDHQAIKKIWAVLQSL